jgi:signal transduction histidine kinase
MLRPTCSVSFRNLSQTSIVILEAVRHWSSFVGITAGVVLRIQDQGHGMPRDIRQRRKLTSVGVGIPGMRERVGQHKGRMEIKSGPRGTSVTVTIPNVRDRGVTKLIGQE